MDPVIEAFRRAHRVAKLLSYEEAAGPIAALPSLALDGQLGPWEDQLVGQALRVLRNRGVPEPVRGSKPVFDRVIQAVHSCQETVSDVDSLAEAGRKPSP